MQEIIFDIGANRGEFGLELAKTNPDASFYLFEPISHLVDHMNDQKDQHNLKNVKIYSFGIGSENTEAPFYYSEYGDMGISSFKQLNDVNIESDEYWQTRRDLQMTSVIEAVKVKRLDHFIVENNIDQIDFMKIDAQGMTWEILQSLGSHIDKLMAGMIESPSTEFSALYKDEKLLSAFLIFLEKNGFKIMKVKPNDEACNELNIFFSRSINNWRETVDSLDLNMNSIFSGKDFWGGPSCQFNAEINRLNARINEQDAEINRLHAQING